MRVKRIILIPVLVGGLICLLGTTIGLAYNEAPMLRELVAAGELPPVEERLPEEPAVLKPLEEIGQYGGTLHTFAINNLPWGDLEEEPERGTYLLRFAEDGITVEGNIAKGYKLSDDAKSLTIYLRKGLKWSDGYPFTADDFLFMFEDLHENDKISTWGPPPAVKRVKKIDDYTVRLEADESSPVMLLEMAQWFGSDWRSFQPKHYLKKWHIKYNPKANELAKKEGFDNWWSALHYHFWWSPVTDINKPTLQPWVFKKFTTTTKVFERNPYYWKVDTAGNQLPYVDRIICNIVDPEVYQVKILQGEADIAWMQTSLENYPLYEENKDKGGYRVVRLPGFHGAEVAFGINQNEPNPALRKIYQDVRFRQALSLAINREEINETVYFGLAVPRQATVLPTVNYYKKEWGEAYAQYDPDEANRLLDEIGLTERDKDGFRIGPDGKTMLLLVEFGESVGSKSSLAVLELVKEYWENIGLKVMLKSEGSALFSQRKNSSDHGIIVAPLYFCTEVFEYTEPYWTTVRMCDVSWCYDWSVWLNAEYDIRTEKKTLEDFGGKLPGEEPPQEIKELREWEIQARKYKLGSKEYNELVQKIHDWHAKNLVVIGTVGMAPHPLIVNKNLGNVPKAFAPFMGWLGDLNYYAEQLFFKQ